MKPSAPNGLDLHDIISAPAPAFWPPAPGWWVLAAVLLVGLLVLARYLIVLWRRRRQRNHILDELESLSTEHPEQLPSHLSTLLRRVALMCFARQEVASLSGEAWLAFLDRTGGDGAFVNGVGSILASAPYAPAHTANDIDPQALIALGRQWLTHNLEKCT